MTLQTRAASRVLGSLLALLVPRLARAAEPLPEAPGRGTPRPVLRKGMAIGSSGSPVPGARRVIGWGILALALALALLVAGPMVQPGKAAGDEGFSMLIMSDSQYPWWRHGNDPDCMTDECVKVRATTTNAELIVAMNRILELGSWPANGNFTRGVGSAISDVSGVIVNGDLTSFFHPYQASWFESTYPGLLDFPMYPGLGNHDYQNNVDDCAFGTATTTYWPDSDRCAKEAAWYLGGWIYGNRASIVNWDWPGMAAVKNTGGYVARLTLSYWLNGLPVIRQTDTLEITQWGGFSVPMAATNIAVIIENHTGFAWQTIASYAPPERSGSCWELSGTTFNPKVEATPCMAVWPPGARGSLAYSFDIGDYHFIQLNNYPGYEVDLEARQVAQASLPGLYDGTVSPAVAITPALNWLKGDVRGATAAGKNVVINMHAFGSAINDWQFEDAIRGGRVVAIFAGHIHEQFGQGIDTFTNTYAGKQYDVPWFRSGSAECESFLLADFREGYFNVSAVRSTGGAPRFVSDNSEVCDPRPYSTWVYDPDDPPPDYSVNSVLKTQGTYRAINEAPTVTGEMTGPAEEGRAAEFRASGSDPEGERLEFFWTFGDGTAGVSGETASHVYADNGTYEVTVTATDESGASASDVFSVAVANVAPRIAVDAVPVAIDEGESVTLAGRIGDPGALDSFTLRTDWGDGTVSDSFVAPGARSFDLTHAYVDDDPSGTPADTYVVNLTLTDKDGASASDSMKVTVRNVDPEARIVRLLDEAGREIGASDKVPLGSAVTLEATSSDVPEDVLTATLDWGDGTPPVPLPGPGEASVAHAFARTGTFTLTLRVADDDLGVATAARALSVVAAPVASADGFGATEDATLSVAAPGVLTNDTGPDGGILTASVGSGPRYGTLALNPDGSFRYTPQADFNGTDNFTYLASDGGLTSAPATVTITVAAVNDAPFALSDAYGTDEDVAVSAGMSGVLGNDTDVEGSALTAVLVAGPVMGSVALNADGSFSYSPAANANGTDTFSYFAHDGDLASAPATVTLTIRAVNDAPLAAALSVATSEGVPVPIPLAGFDADGDPLTFDVIAGPSHGTLTGPMPNPTYTPAAGFSGEDALRYVVRDASATSAPAVVTITVASGPDGHLRGHGHILRAGYKHAFRFRAFERGDFERGAASYRRYGEKNAAHGRHSRPEHFEATLITAIVFSDAVAIRPGHGRPPAVDTVVMTGLGNWNGVAGHYFMLRAADLGEPGRGRDRFAIVITAPSGDVVAQEDGTLAAGDVESVGLSSPRR